MKDFLGNELEIGDSVVFVPNTTGRYATGFCISNIIRFTPAKVEVMWENPRWRTTTPEKRLVNPNYIIKLLGGQAIAKD